MFTRPEVDADGDVKPYDLTEIKDDHQVIRFISHEHVATDQLGRKYISSGAFNKSSPKKGGKYPGMSIELKPLVDEDYQDAAVYAYSTILNKSSDLGGAVLIVVEDIRKLPAPEKYMVGYEPLLGPPPNDYHGEVWGRFSRGDFNIIKHKFEWLVEYPNCALVL